MRNSRLLFAAMLCIAALSGGCVATPAVWGVKSCAPAPEPHLAIAFAPDKYDFLVTYSEQRGWSSKPVQTNSYWLLAHADNLPTNHRPMLIQDANMPGLVRVPVLKANEPVPNSGYSAISYPTLGIPTFDLCRNGVDLGRFTLPSYSTDREPANVSRVLLTPPAVIGDTVVVAGGVAIMVIIGGASNGADFSSLWR